MFSSKLNRFTCANQYAEWFLKSPKICFESETAADAIETGLVPIEVCVRTFLATLNERWNS